MGSSRGSYSDSIIFGGQDDSGNYLSDIWVLRAYDASVTQSGQEWSGFGNGVLQTGANANGAGVSVQYITTCATALASASPTGSGRGSPTASPPSSSSTRPLSNLIYPFDTSIIHKSLAPISLALLFPTVILYRLSLPSTSSSPLQLSFFLRRASVLMLIVAYGAGVAGLVSSFLSITASSSGSLSRRATSSSKVLKTTHGQAGLALFISLYGLIPLLFAAYYLRRRLFASPRDIVGKIRAERSRADSTDTAEKLNSYRNPADSSQRGIVRPPAPASSAGYTPSRKRLGFWFQSREGRMSSESATESESPVPHTFEVVNRPARTRHPSAGGAPSLHEPAYRTTTPRNLSNLSWLERRRSVNAMVCLNERGQGRLADLKPHTVE